MAAIAFVDMDAAGLDPGELFEFGNHRPQGVAVKRIAMQCFGVQHKLAAFALGLVAGVALDYAPAFVLWPARLARSSAGAW